MDKLAVVAAGTVKHPTVLLEQSNQVMDFDRDDSTSSSSADAAQEQQRQPT